MFAPWQIGSAYPMFRPVFMRMRVPLMATASGAFPVPESLAPDQFPPAVKASLMRLMQGPPKPAVTLAVMNQAQASMIAPDLPFKTNV